MLIVTAKIPRQRLALGAAAAALICCCTMIAPHFSSSSTREVSAVTLPDPKGVRSNQDRVEYLKAYGWQVQEEPLTSQELLIPEEMDESFSEYLALQLEQGFDLARYAGKRVKRYTYEVTNYPSGESGIQANLLLYRNTVIGGEILSPELDGFLHGLTMP